jgi:hypothetical protein
MQGLSFKSLGKSNKGNRNHYCYKGRSALK